MKKVSFEGVDKKILKLGPKFISAIKKKVAEKVGDRDLDDYKIVWKQLQEIVTTAVAPILENEFKEATLKIPESKSTYPDIKMNYKGLTFAFDVKSNESSKQPWYDIARLDTIEKKRLSKFDEEYDFVVKYDSKTKKFLHIYFEPLRHTVGKYPQSGGIKYRPYDGKIRPKTWGDFENAAVYWKTKGDFKKGLRKSKVYRWKGICKDATKELTKKEKEVFKKLFD